MKSLVLLLTLATAASAGIVHSGSFSKDDDVQLFYVTLQTDDTLTVRSAGFGGDSALSIPDGGFDTILSLFDATSGQLLLAYDNDGGCSNVSPDSATGFCWDAYLSIPLFSGQYIVALTQYDNLPFGPTLSDGFLRSGEGNFTPALSGFPGTSFLDIFGNQRTANWTVIFDGATDVSTVPEPGTFGLALLALAALGRRVYKI